MIHGKKSIARFILLFFFSVMITPFCVSSHVYEISEESKIDSDNTTATPSSVGDGNPFPDFDIKNYIGNNNIIIPDSRFLSNVTVDNRDFLLEKLSNDSECFTWNKVVCALGYIGDEKSVLSLIEFIRRKPNEKINDVKSRAMLESCEALGMAAQKSDLAFELLKNGIDPTFWEPYASGYRLANKERSNRFMRETLVEHTIHGLGTSGRDEVRSLVKGWIENPNEFSKRYSGNIAQCKFYLDWIAKYGMEDFRKGVFSPIHGDRWEEWKDANKTFMEWVHRNRP